MARSICIALSPSPPEAAGSIVDPVSPATSSPPTAAAPPTAFDRPPANREESYAPAGDVASLPGTLSPLATAAPGTTDDPTAIGEESRVPTRPDAVNASHPWSPFEKVCVPDPATCVCPGLDGSDYRGPINTTNTGVVCERLGMGWAYGYSSSGLEGNYCRNPDNDQDGPWCFTNEDGIERESYCKNLKS